MHFPDYEIMTVMLETRLITEMEGVEESVEEGVKLNIDTINMSNRWFEF